MGPTAASHSEREQTARAAVDSLGKHAGDHVALMVTCPRSHHVAVVLATETGLVFRSVPAAHSHGRRDFVDTGHHGTNGRAWYDLLDPGDGPAVDDDLPAGCECGRRTLSRRLLREHVAAGERHIVIE
ncbi:MAG: hypothetical protein ACOYXW_18380 [Actinomycetota bacterium]